MIHQPDIFVNQIVIGVEYVNVMMIIHHTRDDVFDCFDLTIINHNVALLVFKCQITGGVFTVYPSPPIVFDFTTLFVTWIKQITMFVGFNPHVFIVQGDGNMTNVPRGPWDRLPNPVV